MVGPVATCAGSAGGAQPPHDNPCRVPSNCHSALSTAPHVRKCRGKAIGKKILMRVGQIGGPIPLDWDIEYGTWKALGPDASLYASGVGIQVRHCCKPYHDGWEIVPVDLRELTYERIKSWFSLSDPFLAEVPRRDCGDAYRGWKNDLKAHFNKHGEKDNLDRARLHPPRSITDAVHWERCIQTHNCHIFQYLRSQVHVLLHHRVDLRVIGIFKGFGMVSITLVMFWYGFDYTNLVLGLYRLH